MKIRGAGLPRTGTMSTRTALEKLDLAPCFHGDCPITQNLAGPATQFYRGEKDALLDALRSYPAGLDWPIVGLFDELMAHYPDAVCCTQCGYAHFAPLFGKQCTPFYTRIHGLTSVEFLRLFDLFFELLRIDYVMM